MDDTNNDTSPADRDSRIKGSLEELRQLLWGADAIVGVVRLALDVGASDRDLTGNELYEASKALEVASKQINAATGKMEGAVFLGDVDKSLKGDAAEVQP